MDLRPIPVEASPAERDAIDRACDAAELGAAGPPVDAAKLRRSLLLPVLLAVQERIGWISPGALGHVCRRLEVPPAEGYAVASFYALLALGQRPANFAHVCDDVVCQTAGAERLCEDLRQRLGPAFAPAHRAEPGAPRPTSAARWGRSPCLGLCDQAPAALVTLADVQRPRACAFGAATVARIESALAGDFPVAAPSRTGGQGERVQLARAGSAAPASFEAYRDRGGARALQQALERGAPAVLRELQDGKLVGRGGAAFPTARKWEAVRNAPAQPHFVVCNADESEPGTFKDRVLLEEDPLRVIEALVLAGFVTGSCRGYLYLRGEYPRAAERLQAALLEARRGGMLGASVLGGAFGFDVELRRGAGAYICGEETALCASIEGYRGEPRTKPPFPVEVGLFGKPTAINNVETLVAAADLVQHGARALSRCGTPDSPGTKLFCVSGAIERPGVYEVPFGTPLRALIALAGGVTPGRKLAAVLLGGAAGSFVGPEQLDLPLSFEGARKASASLGSGVVFVVPEGQDLLGLLRRIAAFFRDESCGQCVPCRVGTVRQEELLARLARGATHGSPAEELALLSELGQAMRDASICGLGQTASSAIESALKRFAPFAGARP